MKKIQPKPCLSVLKEHEYCDFYEGVYLFGCNKPDKLNKGLETAYIYPKKNDESSTLAYSKCQRKFVLRRISYYEHTRDFGTSSFPPGERKVVNFFNTLWEKLQIVKKDKPKGYKSLFYPLPSKILEFKADMHVGDAFGFDLAPTFKFFHFYDLIHEVIFSNKMSSHYCIKLEIDRTISDEYVVYNIKSRNLVIRTVAYYLLNSKTELKWNLQSVIETDHMKSALEIFEIPKSSAFRLIKDEIKKVIPEGLVRSGRSHNKKWSLKELTIKPLLITEGFETDPGGNININYQVIRTIIRTLILANLQDNPYLTIDEILKNPLLKFYISKLSPKGCNYCKSEATRYLQSQRDYYRNM